MRGVFCVEKKIRLEYTGRFFYLNKTQKALPVEHFFNRVILLFSPNLCCYTVFFNTRTVANILRTAIATTSCMQVRKAAGLKVAT